VPTDQTDNTHTDEEIQQQLVDLVREVRGMFDRQDQRQDFPGV